MFWLFKAESFSWALLQNSCNSRSGWCTLHNVFPGEKCWTARLKSTLPRGRSHTAAQFAPLSWLASQLGLHRDCSQLFIQMINTDPLLRLNCLGHFAVREWERTRERSHFKKWAGLDSPWVLGRLFLFSHIKCVFNISSGIHQAESEQKRFALGQGCCLSLCFYFIYFMWPGDIFEKVAGTNGRVVRQRRGKNWSTLHSCRMLILHQNESLWSIINSPTKALIWPCPAGTHHTRWRLDTALRQAVFIKSIAKLLPPVSFCLEAHQSLFFKKTQVYDQMAVIEWDIVLEIWSKLSK